MLSSLLRAFGFGQQARARQSLSLVSTGTNLAGSIETPGSLRVEGHLKGDVQVQGTVEVVKGAVIVGSDLHCQDLLVAGTVQARVHATGSITVISGGCLQGDLSCRDLRVARGADVRGYLSLGEAWSDSSSGERPVLPAALELRGQTHDAPA